MQNETFNPLNLIWILPLGFVLISSFINGLALIIIFIYKFIYLHCSFTRNEWLKKLIAKLSIFLAWIAIIGLMDVIPDNKGVVLFGSFIWIALIVGFIHIYPSIFQWIKNKIAFFIPESTKQRKMHYESHYTPPHPHSEPHEAPNPHQQDAVRLVGLGLAAIGRRTAQPNPYLTPEREAQRHNAERPFLLKLAPKYKDASARKVLAKHFMLYKEACLYIIFASLLKDNPKMHSLVKQELTKQLAEGLSAKALIRRKEYMFAFSRAFYDEYQRTRSVERVLSFMFCQVLRDKHPELGSEEIGGLVELYRYVYEEVKGH